jgi:lipoprotein signal peptidase
MRWLLVIWFGDTAPVRKCRDLILVALPWLVADVMTKCLALKLLKEQEVSLLSGGLKLFLTINESLFAHGRTPSRAGTTDAVVFWGAMSVGLAAVACFPFARAQWTVPRKLMLMLVVLVGGYAAGIFLGHQLEWQPQRLVLYAMRAFSSTAIFLLALRLTRSRYLGLAISLALAGVLGNSIGVAYYPRGVIDFIYVPRFSPLLGIFNLADVALLLAMGLILLSPLVLVLYRRLGRGNPMWERRLEYVNPIEPAAPTPEPNRG